MDSVSVKSEVELQLRDNVAYGQVKVYLFCLAIIVHKR